jgi:uncharacterized protein (DUF927 family)
VPYRLPELLTADPAAFVFIPEGEKDVDNLRALGLVATCNPGGAGKWRTDYGKWLSGRDVIVLPDCDLQSVNSDGSPKFHPDGRPVLTGQDHAAEVAVKLARFARSVRVIPVPFLGMTGKHDVSDWLAQGNTKDDLIALAQATPVAGKPNQATGDGPDRFKLDPQTGLWFLPPPSGDTDPPPFWLCAPFEILGDTADERDCEHGLWLTWADNRNARHTYALPMRLIHADGGGLAAELHSMGLRCDPSRKGHDLIKTYLGSYRAKRHMRCVVRAGWHGSVYAMPDGRVLGGDDLVLQTGRYVSAGAYAARGTLADWQQEVAEYATGNPQLALSICASLGAPLLEIINAQSGGVHLAGDSQIGKTTMQRGAASVWGPSDLQLRTWRGTQNGLEGVAAERCDGLLTLDDTSQAEPREIVPIIYLFGNEQGKARASRTGAAVLPSMFRITVISSGEKSIAATLAEIGKRMPAGADVRLLTIPADGGAGHGVWRDLHGKRDGRALTDHLRDATKKYCGTAGPEFLHELVELRQGGAEALQQRLRAFIDKFLEEVLPGDSDGQVRTGAARFGLYAAAGELAVSLGILPWQRGEARKAAANCFGLWLDERGGSKAAEDIAAVQAMRALLSAHGSSRFESAKKSSPNKWGDDRDPPRIVNRLGYTKTNGGDDIEEFWFPAGGWSEVCGGFGLAPKKVAEALKDAGYLLGAGSRHLTDTQRVWNLPNAIRVYRVSSAILSDAGSAQP